MRLLNDWNDHRNFEQPYTVDDLDLGPGARRIMRLTLADQDESARCTMINTAAAFPKPKEGKDFALREYIGKYTKGVLGSSEIHRTKPISSSYEELHPQKQESDRNRKR